MPCCKADETKSNIYEIEQDEEPLLDFSLLRHVLASWRPLFFLTLCTDGFGIRLDALSDVDRCFVVNS